MPNKFARSNGDFNGPIWALTSSGVAGSTTTPTIGDNAYSNSFTVQITGDVACDLISNAGGTLGGRFNVFSSTNTINISSNVSTTGFGAFVNYTTYACLSVTNPQTTTIFGSLTSVNTNSANHVVIIDTTGNVNILGNLISNPFSSSNQGGVPVYCSRVNTLNITGNITGGNNNSGATIQAVGLRNLSNGSINIYGNITTIGNQEGIYNQGTSPGSITIYGNINAGSNVNGTGLANTSTGAVTVYGNLNGGTATGLSNTSTGAVTVLGNIVGNRSFGIASTNAAANVRISGNLIGAPNGIPAVYAASYTVNPVPYQTYIRYANNGTGVGSDAYLYHYTTDSLSAFSMPPVSAVRAGLQYANNTLTGTCQMPAASAVNFGALVGNTTGTAALTSNTLFDVSVASLTASNSLGARLKNSATVESVGRIIASFSN